ncbi:hypothetical protein EG328_011219 [Venturia inaequalis]|uniref:Uncharacterized protein n=1 Tax=Venturia inaequalis TaxID=5025 RepID=A0A8H3V4W2_VENIN|nr:hypothetical protein EG327_007448 [Venturia inaequalis]KAE9982115.1 hypothetical protein EG328_011219 [Venturia inaequalis]RDI89883.1 hypothetical protein Vi05172_g834 [Venturia inaequalis]
MRLFASIALLAGLISAIPIDSTTSAPATTDAATVTTTPSTTQAQGETSDYGPPRGSYNGNYNPNSYNPNSYNGGGSRSYNNGYNGGSKPANTIEKGFGEIADGFGKVLGGGTGLLGGYAGDILHGFEYGAGGGGGGSKGRGYKRFVEMLRRA